MIKRRLLFILLFFITIPLFTEDIMTITSSAFEHEKTIPEKFSCDGEDISPELTWSDAPEETQAFALIMDDPDAPVGTFVHWVYFNIPADRTGLPEAVPSGVEPATGGMQGKNSWGNNEYGGPCPPGGTHRYYFKFYALDTTLQLDQSADKTELENAMEGHIIAETRLMGTFSR